MAVLDHTRLVGTAKIVLPLVALGLLSSLFLLARTVDPDDALPYAEVDLSERARDRQLTDPRFAGVTEEGTAFSLTSDAARPDPERASRLTADRTFLVLDGGSRGGAAMRADTAVVDGDARTVELTGDVSVGTSTGYDLRTDVMTGRIDRLEIVAPGRVTGDGPLGRLNAGGMRLTETGDGAQTLVFHGGVELLYLPPPE